MRIAIGRISYGLSVCLLVLGGGYAFARPLDPLTDQQLAERVRELSYAPVRPDRSGKIELPEATDCEPTSFVMKVQDPVTRDVQATSLTFYRPESTEKVPVVVVVPTIKGITMVEPKVASQLCAAGMGAVIADVVDTSLPDSMPAIGHEDLHARLAIVALRTAIDLLSHDPHFDKNKIGLIGLSVGAIMTSMVAGLEADRLKAIVTVLAGGNLPFILSTSDQDKIANLREQRMTALNLSTVEQYEDWLRPTMKYDPMYFAPYVNRDRIMMVLAKSDTKVPYSQQLELFHAFGQPYFSEYRGGHVDTILALTYWYFGDVINFFKLKFEMAEYGFAPPKTLAPTYH